MLWQDIIFTVGNFIFAIALIPSVIGKQKPAFSTCIISSFVLTLFIVAFASLKLYGSAIGVASSTIAWWVLAFQTYSKRNK